MIVATSLSISTVVILGVGIWNNALPYYRALTIHFLLNGLGEWNIRLIMEIQSW